MTKAGRFHAPRWESTPDWAALQDELAVRAVSYGAERSAEIRGRLDRAGVAADSVRGVAGLGPIPVLAKDDLPELQAADPPFGGMLAVPLGSLRRVYQSPGPIVDPEGATDDFWRLGPAVFAAGFRQGDVVLNTFSYHLTPGGFMLDSGLRALGCVVVPGGVGNTAAQVEMAAATGATGYTGTPQFLLILLEKAAELGVDLGFRRALVTGAPLPPSLRERLQSEFGVDVYQSYGTADAGTLGYECEAKNGWHVATEVVVEVLDPGSDTPVGAGEPGQVVVTSPNEAYPLVRFGTGDLSALDPAPCRCGRTSPRLMGFLGRVGEGIKVKGMFVHPRQLAGAVGSDAAVAAYRGVVTGDAHRDELIVQVVAREGASLDVPGLTARIRDAVKIRPTVEVVEAGAISDGGPVLVDERGD